MSTHSVNIIEISEVKPHTNADRLEIIPIGGWQVVVRKGEFKVGDKAVYIEPDYTVPLNRDEFSFLDDGKGKERHRLRAVRLRGELSYGLLIPVPKNLSHLPVGANVMSELGIERWEPKPKGGQSSHPGNKIKVNGPHIRFSPKFDLENYQRYPNLFKEGEPIWALEKIDGANARYCWNNGKMHIGSRNHWLKHDMSWWEKFRDWFKYLFKKKKNYQHPQTIWKQALEKYPQITEWCKAHPNHVLFGEVYGDVQDLKYGMQDGEVAFAAFAAINGDTGQWVDFGFLKSTLDMYNVPVVPVVYCGPFNSEVFVLAEQDSFIGPSGHIMEGIVLLPEKERFDPNFGRVTLKYISKRFWEHDNG